MRRILSILIFFLAAFSALSVEKIVVAVMQDPDFLDPHRAAASGTYEMMFNVFEGLLKPDSKGNVVPAIAESYSISPDGLTYTFKLREGVKFHNGREVTMTDVLYSFNRLKGSGEVRGLSSDFE
ncbi:MAG: ABC transporter substrate-binding protein, partial [Mesotoga sp.]|nr:ABC transporter substrate-binding protein [Mesotoga sp.]